MLSGSSKPLQLLSDAEEEKEFADKETDDTVSDPNGGSCAVGMLYGTGVFRGLPMSACLLPSPGQITIGLVKLWLALQILSQSWNSCDAF